MSETIQQHIQEYGWHCIHVFPGTEDQGRFTYSIGFAESFDAPEVMVFGLAREKAHALLTECAALLKSGATIEPDVEDDRILAGGYSVVFKAVRAEAFGEHLGTACRYYGDRAFEAVVMFLPDKENNFPWQSEYIGHDTNEAQSIVLRGGREH